MAKSYDAIIIGAGIIGACTAFELAKKGWKTLNIDKLPEAGYGSTSGSCIVSLSDMLRLPVVAGFSPPLGPRGCRR